MTHEGQNRSTQNQIQIPDSEDPGNIESTGSRAFNLSSSVISVKAWVMTLHPESLLPLLITLKLVFEGGFSCPSAIKRRICGFNLTDKRHKAEGVTGREKDVCEEEEDGVTHNRCSISRCQEKCDSVKMEKN